MSLFHRLAFLLSVTAPLAVSCWARADGDGDPACPLPAPAFSAESFNDSIAINDNPFQGKITEGPFAGAGIDNPVMAQKLWVDLGIRHYRASLRDDLTRPDQPASMKSAYDRYGFRPMFLLDPRKVGTPQEFVGLLKRYEPGLTALIEGPNEVNNKFPPQELNLRYGGKTDEAAGAAWQADYYAAARSDPATRDIPWVAFTAIFTDYRDAKPFADFEFANMHSYQGYGVPSSSLLANVTQFNNILPVGTVIKPFVPTECGYNVFATDAAERAAQLRVQARRLPMLTAEYFRHGIRREYLFAMYNADGYGLVESDESTRRPAYYGLKAWVAAMKDASWNPATREWSGANYSVGRTLLFTAAGADGGALPSTIHTLTLRKKNGEYSLLIWNEVKNYDDAAKKEVVHAPVPVTLRLRTPVEPSATVLSQTADGTDFVRSAVTVTGGRLTLAVPDAPMIVRLRVLPGADKTAPAAPEEFRGTATENSARLSWKAPRGANDVAGYFLFRNDRFIAHVAGTEYDDTSSWLRPGLGYTYAVQAYDKAGNMSPRRKAVVQTAPKFPDPVVVRVGCEPANPKPGDSVVFKATVRNVGSGGLPSGVPLSATFSVNGKYTTFAFIAGDALAPGETREIRSGQVKLEAPAGAKSVLLGCLLDDVNRIPNELDKMNNRADVSLRLDATDDAGMLAGSAAANPGTVDLSAEGTQDWVHFGLGGKDAVTRKSDGGGKIGPLTVFGEGHLDATPGFAVRSSWKGGAPVATQNETYSALWWNGVGKGVRFTAPADTGEQVLKLYVGGVEGARGKLTAKLSDGSAPEYVSTTFDGNRTGFDWAPSPGAFTAVYTLRYKAGKPGQNLEVSWTLDQEPNRYRGQAMLQAVTLSRPSDGK